MAQPESMTKIVDMCGDERIRVIPIYGMSGAKQCLAVELPDTMTGDLDSYILEITASLRTLSVALVKRYGSDSLKAQLEMMLRRQA